MRRSLAWFIPAVIFLCNPNITVLDPFPDFIGYFFLTLALSKIADLNEELFQARTAFSRMILIDAGRLLAILWIFGMEAAGERSSSFLLWTFVFGFLEVILLIPAYGHLFNGLLHLGNLYENRVIFAHPKHAKRGGTLLERLRGFTCFFVIVKAAMAFLPELADLSNLAYDEQGSTLNLYRYIGTMRVLCFLPALVIGIVWLCRMIRFVTRLQGDSTLMQALSSAYEETVVPNRSLFIGRSVTRSFAVFLLGAVLTLDFRLDRVNFLPDILAFLAFAISFLILRKKTAIQKGRTAAALAFYGVMCVASTVVQTVFFHRYSYGSLLRNDGALTLFSVLLLIEIVRAAAFMLLGLCTANAWKCVVSEHTGFILEESAHAEIISRHVESVHKELRTSIAYMTAAMVVYALSDVAYEIFAPDLGFIGLVNGICAVIWIATVWKAQSEISAAVKSKYMLE